MSEISGKDIEVTKDGNRPRRRIGGPTWQMFSDIVVGSWWTRNWVVLALLVLTIVASIAAVAGQVAVPWAVYPAL